MHRSLIQHMLCMVFITGYFPCMNFAQDSTEHDSPKFFWAHSGGGLGSYALAFSGGVTYQSGDHLIAFNFNGTTEFNILGPSPTEETFDYAFLYGRALVTHRVSFGVFAGISYVSSVVRGEKLAGSATPFIQIDKYERLESHAIGFPIRAQYVSVISPVFGIGLAAFGDLNRAKSFGGVVLSLNFGKLK